MEMSMAGDCSEFQCRNVTIAALTVTRQSAVVITSGNERLLKCKALSDGRALRIEKTAMFSTHIAMLLTAFQNGTGVNIGLLKDPDSSKECRVHTISYPGWDN